MTISNVKGDLTNNIRPTTLNKKFKNKIREDILQNDNLINKIKEYEKTSKNNKIATNTIKNILNNDKIKYENIDKIKYENIDKIKYENIDDNEDTDDESNFRNKDKEFREHLKTNLSFKTQDVINFNNEELNEIIEQLKQKGVSSEKGLELQNFKTINRGSRNLVK